MSSVKIIQAGEGTPAADPTASFSAQPAAAPAAAAQPARSGGSKLHLVTDSDGRRIGIRDLTLVDEMRITRVVGGVNPAFMWFCLKLAHVAEIDGSPVPVPPTEMQFEVLAQRLGHAGMRAINAHFSAEAEIAEQRQNEHRDQVGN